MNCPRCQHEVLEIDVKCGHCGAPLGSTGAHRMIGQMVIGTYEIVDVLGQGGMSVVYKARHKLTEQEVALKVLPPELAAHSQVKSRFLEEAKALAALDHPNIVHLYNFGQENGSFVLAMQLVQGKTWERHILEGRRLDWRTSAKIAIDVLKALEYAHGRGIVHRDMKPSNVLVRADDQTATVMDFGIAKMTTSTRLTATGQTMGTVRYMSPEQVRGQEVDARTDIYSLGATLYESLVGDTPFDGNTHFEIMTKHLSEAPQRPSSAGIEVPPAIEDAIMRSLAKRAEDRWDSARDLRRVLESALRASDVGLGETAGRSAVGIARAPSPGASGASELPTARSAALDAGTDEGLVLDDSEAVPAIPPPRRRAARWPYALLSAVILASGAGVTFVAMRRPPRGYVPVAAFEGVTLTAGKRFGKVLVETDGRITPDEVNTQLQIAIDAVRAAASDVPLRTDVIDHVVVLPQAQLCQANLYLGSKRPSDCVTARAELTIGAHGSHMLLVADDSSTLTATLKYGVAQAVCLFQPNPPTGSDQDDKICDLPKQFAPH